MPELISIDLATLLLFTMPGFFFLKALGYKNKSDFEYFMFSLFIGMLLLIFVYSNIFPDERLSPMLNNPYAGAIIFSILGIALGLFIQFLKSKIKFPIEF